jgi:hypothetical protein
VRTILKAAALAILMAPAVQAAPLPGFSLVAETPRFAFYSRGGHVDAAKVERTVGRYEALLGVHLDKRADYYRYDSAQEVAAGTGFYADGVTYAQTNEVHSVEACHDHELVHLVAGHLGDPGSFFQEGLAVALGNGGKWQGQPVDRIARRVNVPVRTLVQRMDALDPNAAYAVAGSFVSHLIKSHGIEKVAAFFRACPTGTNDVRAAFTQVFGTSIDEADAAWRAAL